MITPEESLNQRGIRPTALRLLILKQMQAADCAVSQADLENSLVTVDKSTVSRTLSLFVEKHLAHCFTGADGLLMYALCPPACHCHDRQHPELNDMHAHFTCTVCHRTFCLRNRPIPVAEVPEGFSISTASYLITGVCRECNASRK